VDLIWNGFIEAIELIFSGDQYVYEVTLTSLFLSGTATLIALALGLSFAALLAFGRPPGRTLALSGFNAGMALPPVIVGLLVSIMLWRSGPLGMLHLSYSRGAIIIAQALIATPVIAALSTVALQGLNPKLRLQILR
jgi:tungstate transport system permease protein